MIGALDNIADGNGPAWDPGKTSRDNDTVSYPHPKLTTNFTGVRLACSL